MKFDQLASAYKRALHFAIPFDGPFSPLHSAVGNNYCRMVYAEQRNSTDELLMLNAWAEALNRMADKNRVMDRLDLREAFSSFLSLMPIDPRPLAH